MPLSLVGLSGVALGLAPQSGKVMGFQNYELWINDPPPREVYREPVEALYMREDRAHPIGKSYNIRNPSASR